MSFSHWYKKLFIKSKIFERKLDYYYENSNCAINPNLALEKLRKKDIYRFGPSLLKNPNMTCAFFILHYPLFNVKRYEQILHLNETFFDSELKKFRKFMEEQKLPYDSYHLEVFEEKIYINPNLTKLFSDSEIISNPRLKTELAFNPYITEKQFLNLNPNEQELRYFASNPNASYKWKELYPEEYSTNEKFYNDVVFSRLKLNF